MSGLDIATNISESVTFKELPPSPKTIEETGLYKEVISELLIKFLYKYGKLSSVEIADNIKLPFFILEPILDDLIDNKLVEKTGQGMGGIEKKYSLLNAGYLQSENIIKKDSYIGPAPVTLEEYAEFVKYNQYNYDLLNVDVLKEAWSDLVLEDHYFNQIGPAIYSGRSCYLYGPAGSGKTFMANKIAGFIREYFSEIFIPYAIYVAGYVIQIFDPIYHTIEHSQDSQVIKKNLYDRRWVRSKRPVVVCGGELTLNMLDLQYKKNVHFYEAPLQMKANGGVLIIDDFGRQYVEAKNLLNRWIYPLEEKKDFLSLHTGYKFPVPFDIYVIFATNIPLEKMQDDAFMRRIPYKINLENINKESFMKIFEKECAMMNVQYNKEEIEHFLEVYYLNTNKTLMAYQPKELALKIRNYCKFNKLDLIVTNEILSDLFNIYV